MKMQEVRERAKKLGVSSFGKKKADLIREIQRAEGNFDCFGTALGFCDQQECVFRDICLLENGTKAAARGKGKGRKGACGARGKKG